MFTTHEWSLPGADGHPILGVAHLPDDAPRGVLLICHGFKGYMDYGFMPVLAHAAAKAGLIAHRFNFSHSGMTRNTASFERAALFERDTWGKQVFDLHRVAAAVRDGTIAGQGLPQSWFGHSRGGLTAIVAAGLASPNEAPAAIIAAAAMHTADRLDDEDKRLLRKHGRLESPSSRTGEMLYVGRDWLDELDRDPQRFNPILHAERLRIPLLLIHGDNDGTIHVMSARLLHKASRERAKLIVVRGATHNFNAPNPLPLNTPPPPQTKILITEGLAFAARRS